MRLFVFGGPRLPFGFKLGIGFDPREAWSWFRPGPGSPAGTFIYVITDPAGRSKVGVSKDPRERMRELQTGHPERLELVWCAVTPGTGFPIENATKRMGEPRRLSGEWFQIHPMTMANMVHHAALVIGEPLQQVPIDSIGTIIEIAARDSTDAAAQIEPFPLRNPFLFTAIACGVAAIVLSVLLVLRD